MPIAPSPSVSNTGSTAGDNVSNPLEPVTGRMPDGSVPLGNGSILNNPTALQVGNEPAVDTGVLEGSEAELAPPIDLEYGGFAEAYLNGEEPNPQLNSLEPVPAGNGGEAGEGEAGSGTQGSGSQEDNLFDLAPTDPAQPVVVQEPADSGNASSNASELEGGVSELPGNEGRLESTPTSGPPLETELEPSDTTPIVSGGSVNSPTEPVNPGEKTAENPAGEDGPVEASQKALRGIFNLVVNSFEGMI